jgi:hypothetical protein
LLAAAGLTVVDALAYFGRLRQCAMASRLRRIKNAETQMTKLLKITVAGCGYVDVSNAVLLAQHNRKRSSNPSKSLSRFAHQIC